MKIGERGQVTIPKAIRKKFRLHPATEVGFEVVRDIIVLRKRTPGLTRDSPPLPTPPEAPTPPAGHNSASEAGGGPAALGWAEVRSAAGWRTSGDTPCWRKIRSRSPASTCGPPRGSALRWPANTPIATDDSGQPSSRTSGIGIHLKRLDGLHP